MAAMRAGLYARVSTDEQAEEGHSIEAQLRVMRDFARRKGWQVVEEYVDAGYSGKTDRRPAFQRLIADARAGHVDVIVVHKLDRFSRSLFDILKYFRELEAQGVLLASATEVWDFTTPHGRAHFHILAVFAQWYSDNLSAETKKGKQQRALEGKYNGRLPFGYRKGPEGLAVVVPEEAEVIRMAFEAYSTGGYSDQKIADLMNEQGLPTRTGRRWSKDSVRDFLQNAFYVGYVKYHGDLLPGLHEPIISQELFDKCQQVRRSRRGAPRSHSPRLRTYMLNKLIRCCECRRKLRAQSSAGHRYYREMSYQRGLECSRSSIGVVADIPEEQVGEVFMAFRLPEDWQEEIRQQVMAADERQQLLERRKRLEEKLRRIGNLYRDLVISDDQYRRERDAIRAELDALVIPDEREVVEAGLYLETMRDLWAAATLEEQRDICRLVLEAVYYDVRERKLTSLVPKATFLPLFRQNPLLVEIAEGEFAPR